MLYLPPDKPAVKTKPGTYDPPANTDWQQRFAELAETAKDPRLKSFYQGSMPAGDTAIEDVPLVAVDFETTGLDAAKHGIVSIAAVPMCLKRVRLGAARYWLAKPRRSLTDESVVIHGITHSDIEKAPDLDDILEEFLTTVRGCVWVVHFRGIERPFLQRALQERLGESIEFPLIDTMQLEARWHRQQHLPWWRRWRMPGNELSIRLAACRERYNLPFYRPHDAITDAQACGELLQAQVAHNFSGQTPVSEIWVP